MTLDVSLRIMAAAVLSLVLLFGQVFTGMAANAANDPAVWIEICADGESHMIRMDGGTDQQAPDCAHCQNCLLASGDTGAVLPSNAAQSVKIDILIPSVFAAHQTGRNRPEQFGASCRGPPLESRNNPMTTSFYLSLFKAAKDTGAFPAGVLGS